VFESEFAIFSYFRCRRGCLPLKDWSHFESTGEGRKERCRLPRKQAYQEDSKFLATFLHAYILCLQERFNVSYRTPRRSFFSPLFALPYALRWLRTASTLLRPLGDLGDSLPIRPEPSGDSRNSVSPGCMICNQKITNQILSIEKSVLFGPQLDPTDVSAFCTGILEIG
jgi:hypothetical protein